MPVNGFNVTNALLIPLSAVSIDGCPDALSGLLRVGIAIKACLFLPQGSVEALNSSCRLRMTKGNTAMTCAQLGATLRLVLSNPIGTNSEGKEVGTDVLRAIENCLICSSFCECASICGADDRKTSAFCNDKIGKLFGTLKFL